MAKNYWDRDNEFEADPTDWAHCLFVLGDTGEEAVLCVGCAKATSRPMEFIDQAETDEPCAFCGETFETQRRKSLAMLAGEGDDWTF